ncbi:MAG: hypothetical protein SV686_15080 [Thermodesulfobacteriota bacterium]|nr:hypothetical protein [Thermodesulfobacteriota bacterium]
MKKRLIMILFGVFLGVSSHGIAYGERMVVVNGVRLNNAQIQTLEQWHCGRIPDGNYWLNFNTGAWGYAGDPRPMGHISDNCYNQGRRQSLSERGLLFSPRDWVK